MECCHNNGIASDNRLENLRWDTRKKNMLDRVKHGTQAFNEKHRNCKIPNNNILKIRKLYSTGNYTQVELGKIFVCSQSHIGRIVNNKKRKGLGN